MRVHRSIGVLFCALTLGAGCATAPPKAEPVSTPVPGETCKTKAECMGDFDSSTVEVKPAGKVGRPFRNWVFQVTVTKVELLDTIQVRSHDDDLNPVTEQQRAENGRWVVVRVRAKNVGTAPESFCTSCSSLVDSKGRTFTDDTIYTGLDQGFDEDLQPDETENGFMLFDVPRTVTKIRTIVLQPDAYMATENPPADVRVP